MKQIVMFIQQSCPHCQRALGWQRELIAQHPELSRAQVQIVDELREKQLADSYDYYYVPTYFVDGQKVHEGAADKETVERVLRMGLEN